VEIKSPLSLMTPGSLNIVADSLFVYALRKITEVWVSCGELLFGRMVCICGASFLLCTVEKNMMGSELPLDWMAGPRYAAPSGSGKARSNDCLSPGEILGLSQLLYVHFYVIFRKVIYPSPLFVYQVGLKLAIRSERCYGKDQQTEKQTDFLLLH